MGPKNGARPLQRSGLVPFIQSGLQSGSLILSDFDGSQREHGLKSQKCHWLPNSGKQAAVETPTERGADSRCPVARGNPSLWLRVQQPGRPEPCTWGSVGAGGLFTPPHPRPMSPVLHRAGTPCWAVQGQGGQGARGTMAARPTDASSLSPPSVPRPVTVPGQGCLKDGQSFTSQRR